jgi:hypothetical protein
MKIAILESKIKKINGHLKSFDTTSYNSLEQLLQNHKNFDAVIIDKEFITSDVIKTFKNNNIETIVLNFGKIDFNDELVTEIVDYSEIDDIKNTMKYIETKLRIKNFTKKERTNFENIKDLTKKVSFHKI